MKTLALAMIFRIILTTISLLVSTSLSAPKAFADDITPRRLVIIGDSTVK